MEFHLYNIYASKVYKTCDLSTVSAVAENPSTYQKDSDYPIVVRARHRTRIIKLRSGAQAIRAYMDARKSCVDGREFAIITAADKTSASMFRVRC